jgi:hypothetical protein
MDPQPSPPWGYLFPRKREQSRQMERIWSLADLLQALILLLTALSLQAVVSLCSGGPSIETISGDQKIPDRGGSRLTHFRIVPGQRPSPEGRMDADGVSVGCPPGCPPSDDLSLPVQNVASTGDTSASTKSPLARLAFVRPGHALTTVPSLVVHQDRSSRSMPQRGPRQKPDGWRTGRSATFDNYSSSTCSSSLSLRFRFS